MITNLAGESISARVFAAFVGQSSISTTQRYIDVKDVQLRNAAVTRTYRAEVRLLRNVSVQEVRVEADDSINTRIMLEAS